MKHSDKNKKIATKTQVSVTILTKQAEKTFEPLSAA